VDEAFRFFDQGEKGHLTHDEFIKMVQSLGETPTQEKLKELLGNLGKDQVERADCDKMLPDIREQRKSKKDVIDAFKVFDNRSDGHITVDNYRTMMGSLGEKLPMSEVQLAIDKALEVAPGETDGQTAIVYETYVDWMMGPDAK